MTYLIILTISLLTFYFFKSENKYWIISIPLWVILVIGFIYWRILSDRHIGQLENQYWKTTIGKGYGDYNLLTSLDESKVVSQERNSIFIYTIVLQTILTFITQIVGQKKTNRKIYKWTKIVFGVLSILALLLIAMMGIVPTGGYIT